MPDLNRRSALLALSAASLPSVALAADPWEKAPAQWDDKDLQKIMADSPWAKTVSIAIGGPSVGEIGGGGRGGRGGRGGGGGGGMADASSSSGMGGSTMGGDGGGGMGGAPGLAPTMTFLIRWQTAKPVKLASVRSRMGAEADTSPQAREFVERQEPDYVVAVVMPTGGRGPGRGPGGPQQGDRKGPSEDAAEKLKESVWLSWKAHDKVHPTSITMPREGQNAFVFHFPKTHPIGLDPEVVNWKTGGTLKNIASAGAVKKDLNGNIPGPHSRNTLKWLAEFRIVTPEGVATTEYQLIRLRANTNYRDFRTVTGGIFNKLSGAMRDMVPFEGKKAAPRTSSVVLPSNLSAGDCGFLFPGTVGSTGNTRAQNGKLYTFRTMD